LRQRCLVARVDAQGTISDHSQQKKSQVVRLFLECLRDRRLLSLEVITEADVVRFLDELLAAGRRAVTVNGLVRKILAKPFREARAKGLIQIDLIPGMKAIPIAHACPVLYFIFSFPGVAFTVPITFEMPERFSQTKFNLKRWAEILSAVYR